VIVTLACLAGCLLGIQNLGESLMRGRNQIPKTKAGAAAGPGLWIWISLFALSHLLVFELFHVEREAVLS